MLIERVQAAVVILFVLLIAAAVAVLLTSRDDDPPPSPSASSHATSDVDNADADPVGRVDLDAGKGDVVLRTEPGGPRLEISDNRGRTFHQLPVPQVNDGGGVSASSPTVRALVYAEATSPRRLTVGAADTKCKVHRYTTTDAGVTWKQSSKPLTEWYIDPGTGAFVSTAGPSLPGCGKKGPVAFAFATKTTAKVFCANGTVRSTTNGGVSWSGVGTLSDVSAAVFTGPLKGYASVADPSCQSRIYATSNGGVSWSPQGCVIKEFVIPALTGTETRLVAGGPGGVRLSTNGGDTWKPSKKK
jgi:hypothetical protein